MYGYLYAAVLTALIHSSVCILTVKKKTESKNLRTCIEFGFDTKFKNDMVIGAPWRVYYTWNMMVNPNKCLDIKFKNATPMIVNRIHQHMHHYVDYQPRWDSATLVVTMLKSLNEMLFFKVLGKPSVFFAIPDTHKARYRVASVSQIMMFHLRLFKRNKYLVMMDCRRGVTSLMARKGAKEGALALADTLPIPGFGAPACVTDTYENATYLDTI